MILYIENPKDMFRKLLEVISEFSKLTAYKMNTQKSLAEGGKDGGGIGREDHFLPYKFLKRTFQRRANSTKQLL